jgi:hypothetical protein
MFEVDSHCPVAMTVSVDAHTRHGHESQSLSGDAAAKPTLRRAAAGVIGRRAGAPVWGHGGASGLATGGYRLRLLRWRDRLQTPLCLEGGNPFERRQTVILLS